MNTFLGVSATLSINELDVNAIAQSDYVYIEGYFSEDDAIRREMNLKYLGKAYGQLKGRIKNSLRDA